MNKMFGQLCYFSESFRISKVQNIYDNPKIDISQFPIIEMALKAKCEYTRCLKTIFIGRLLTPYKNEKNKIYFM